LLRRALFRSEAAAVSAKALIGGLAENAAGRLLARRPASLSDERASPATFFCFS
jgi:hypothetical protein